MTYAMTNPEQLEFDFMRDDERAAEVVQLWKRALSSIDFEEYEFHRRRIDRLAA